MLCPGRHDNGNDDVHDDDDDGGGDYEQTENVKSFCSFYEVLLTHIVPIPN